MANKHGCYDRAPFKTTMKVQDGYTEGGSHRIPHVVEVPFRMSFECEYRKTDLGKVDNGCEGCNWKKESIA